MGVCPQHCPQPGGALAQAAATVVAAGAVVSVVAAVLPVVWPVLAAAAALAVAAVPVLRWLGRRVTVPRWSAYAARQRAERAVKAYPLRARAALPAPVRAIEAPGLRVVDVTVVREGETIRP